MVHAPLYDTHAHFFSSDLQRYPIDIANAREGEANLRRRILAEPATPERIFGLWDESGVSGGAGVQYNTVYKHDNSYVLDVAEQHANRVAPVVMMNAAAADTPATLTRYINGRGIAGLRLFGRADASGAYPWLDSPAALETWQIADRHGLAMVLMAAPAQVTPAVLERVAALAERFPATTITLDHFAWAGAQPTDLGLPEPLVKMRKHRNVYYKLTTINFHLFDRTGIDAAQFVRRAADIFGADHMMWGSDVSNTLESFVLMAHRARMSAALLTAAESKLFLHDTGARLFPCRDQRTRLAKLA
ncbi:MAG TPA: amidohydrolase family protein [Steroidobacter sp.]|uniref:amidohydrolase family protein n=1 Tax=Steroidobacter sp. TaxID=1978227 RepID=UPI002ED98E76